jgi:hypothetical protein
VISGREPVLGSERRRLDGSRCLVGIMRCVGFRRRCLYRINLLRRTHLVSMRG